MRNRRLPLPAALLAACCIGTAAAQPAPEPGPQAAPRLPRRDEANLVLLEVRLDDNVLADSMAAYRQGRETLLPVGELARLLTLAIRALPGAARAEGFVLREGRGFFLDAARGVAIVEGRTQAFDAALARVLPDDVYVAASLLEQLLPLGLEVNLSTQALTVRPREQLPVQARLERERVGAAAGRRPAEAPALPLQKQPYAMAGVPFIDQSFTLGVTRGGSHQTSVNYSAFVAGDFAGAEGTLYLTSSRDKPTPDVRFTLGRHDPDAGLLGPLGARSIAFGSGVSSPSVTNVAARTAVGKGHGVVVSNRPESQPTNFDRHTLEGDLPQGWDVELYYNDGLAGFQVARPDGRYRFEDLPLAYGANEFRLVFHGPLGQQRVERQVFVLEQSTVPQGAFYYTVGSHRDGEGRARMVGEFEWGASRFLSLDGGLAQLPAPPGADPARGEGGGVYAHVGVHGFWAPFIVSNELYRSPNGGLLSDTGVKTRWGPVAISWGHLQSRDFVSEVLLPSSDPLRSRDTLRIDGALPVPRLPRLPFSLELLREVSASGRVLLGAGGRISAYVHGTSISNQLAWQSVAGVATASGSVQVSRRMGTLGLSGQVGYTLRPQARVESVAMALDQRLASGYQVNLGVVRSIGGRETIGTASLTRDFGSYGLGITCSVSSSGVYSAGLQLFVAMGRDPRSGNWRFDALPRADAGAASVRVFLDNNGNGVFDAGDEPVENAVLVVNGSRSPARTDAQGLAWLDRLPIHQGVDLALDAQSLEDPMWQPLRPGVRIVPRPGVAAEVDFAVVSTSEVEGTVYLQEAGARRGIGNAAVELLDLQRRVLATTRSGADGYYVFTAVRGGNYLLRISPAQLGELGLDDPGLRPVTAPASGDIVGGMDFVLVKP